MDPLPKDRITVAAVATGIDETDLERDLRRSLTERRVTPPTNRRAGASVPPPAPAVTAPSQVPSQHLPTNSSKPNGNGNGYSNGARQATAPAPVPVKIPLNIAFREILAFCTHELRAAHEQWSDAARQDLVSTLLIQAAREGWCTIWERGNSHA